MTAAALCAAIRRQRPPRSLSPPVAAVLCAEKEARFRSLSAAELEPLPGLHELIATAQANGVLLAAVTNAPRPNVVFMLELFGLASAEHPISHDGCQGHAGRLDTVVLGEDCTEAKPHPAPYLLAMERLQVKPEQCIVFEDSESGATAGVRAGAVVVGVMTTKSEEEMRRLGCAHVIRDYTQIDIGKMMRDMTDFVRKG
jgi:beta-phosphoglucomutase-like phosphatase (HAD superfamily)